MKGRRIFTPIEKKEPGNDFKDRDVGRYRKIKSMIRSRLSSADEKKDDKQEEFKASQPKAERSMAGSERAPISGRKFEALTGTPAKHAEPNQAIAREMEDIDEDEKKNKDVRRTLRQLHNLKQNS